MFLVARAVLLSMREHEDFECVLKIVCGWANKTWLLPYACCGLHFTDSAACVLSFDHSTPLHLDQESPSFYHRCNTSDVKSSKPTGCCKTTAMLVLCSIRCQWPNDSFPFEIFLSHLHCFVDYEVSWSANPNSPEWSVAFNGTWNSIAPYKCLFSPQQ